MRVLTLVGARPQFVKAAPVSRALRSRHEEILVHTGQHYDDAMSAAFFSDLELPPPDVNLGVGGGTHAQMTAEMIGRLEPVLAEHEPDAILLYGDTNTTLAGAVVGSKIRFGSGRRPWMAHVEAGLRSFNRSMPEERNRVVADHLSDLLLAPTETAVRNLESERLGRRTRLVGDVMVDALLWAAERSKRAELPELRGLPGPGSYVLLTLHRPDNVDDPRRLAAWLDAFAGTGPVVFPVHPRTRAVLERHGIAPPDNVVAMPPVGYLAMVALEAGARAVATDSGGVQKEAYLLGVPCLTLRSETEWVETVEVGWNRVIGRSPGGLRATLDDEDFMRRDRERPPLYGDGRAADRVVAALEDQAALEEQLSLLDGHASMGEHAPPHDDMAVEEYAR